MLIVHTQDWGHSFGDNASAKATGGGTGDAALEDQLYLLGSTQIQVLADRSFKE